MTATIETLAAKVEVVTIALESERAVLVERVIAGRSAKDLSSHLNAVARLEGEVYGWARMLNAAKHATDLNLVMMDMLAIGANDEGSGRGNDVARARFDGLRNVASDLRWM